MLITHITVLTSTGKELEFDMTKWQHIKSADEITFTSNDGKREWAFMPKHIAAIFRKGK